MAKPIDGLAIFYDAFSASYSSGPGQKPSWPRMFLLPKLRAVCLFRQFVSWSLYAIRYLSSPSFLGLWKIFFTFIVWSISARKFFPLKGTWT